MHLKTEPQKHEAKKKNNNKVTKLRVESSTIVVGNVDTPLSIMDLTVRQEISKEIKNFKKTI